MTILGPKTLSDLCDAVGQATREGMKLEVRGGGSKAEIGASTDAAILDMRGFAGVVDYDPAELVLTVGAGTPLSDVEALVAGEGQMLAFEPYDHGPVFGRGAGEATIGGVIAAGVAGSRRLAMGGARDHLLGFEGVSGRGERFIAGGKVVKNVTGYDLPKLMAGSWGRMAALTEVTLKVLPAPRETATLLVEGLSLSRAYIAMARALGSQAEVSAAAHFPRQLRDDVTLTALRLQGFGPSVAARCAILEALLGQFGTVRTADAAEAEALWRDAQTLVPLNDGRPLWRISIPAKACCMIVATLQPFGARWLADWAGGLLWMTFDGDPAMVRQVAADAGGHATLVRGGPALRAAIPTFQPQSPALAALETRVRRAFDPSGVFETRRFGEPADAD